MPRLGRSAQAHVASAVRASTPPVRAMYTFLLVVLILDALVLVAAVLLQSGKGGGLAASFGGASSTAEALIGTRQAGNLLTRVTWWAAGIFLGLAFTLQIVGARARAPKSVLDTPFSTAPAAPATPAPSGQAAPAVPLAPNTPAPAAPAAPAAPSGTAPKQ